MVVDRSNTSWGGVPGLCCTVPPHHTGAPSVVLQGGPPFLCTVAGHCAQLSELWRCAAAVGCRRSWFIDSDNEPCRRKFYVFCRRGAFPRPGHKDSPSGCWDPGATHAAHTRMRQGCKCQQCSCPVIAACGAAAPHRLAFQTLRLRVCLGCWVGALTVVCMKSDTHNTPLSPFPLSLAPPPPPHTNIRENNCSAVQHPRQEKVARDWTGT